MQPFHPSPCTEGFFHGKLLMHESHPAKATNCCNKQVVVNTAGVREGHASVPMLL